MYHPLRRFVILSVMALITVPVVYYGITYARTPELFPGDELETRDCRICCGDGIDETMAMDYPELGSRCQFCRGDGKVDVIVPGPQRPTWIRGTVLDGSQLSDFERLYQSLPQKNPFEKPRGALAKVRVVVQGGKGKPVEVESNPHGHFAVRLSPGDYDASLSAPGFEPLDGKLEVPVLTEPIWLEEAKLIREPESRAEAQSLYGLQLRALLAPQGRGEGQLQVRFGAP